MVSGGLMRLNILHFLCWCWCYRYEPCTCAFAFLLQCASVYYTFDMYTNAVYTQCVPERKGCRYIEVNLTEKWFLNESYGVSASVT